MSDDQFEIADVFADVARTLLSEHGEEATLDKICVVAVEAIGACEHAGVTAVTGKRLHSVASSDDLPRRVDAIQDEVQEGPCVDAIREDVICVSGSLATEERWPRFAPRAAAEGVDSVMSFRLYSDRTVYGAINLYSTRSDAFGEEDIHLGSLLSAHAAVAFSGMQNQHQFEEALARRDVIGRAKGLISARSAVSDDEAFEMLKKASQRLNLKLHDVARGIAEGAIAPSVAGRSDR